MTTELFTDPATLLDSLPPGGADSAMPGMERVVAGVFALYELAVRVPMDTEQGKYLHQTVHSQLLTLDRFIPREDGYTWAEAFRDIHDIETAQV